MIHHAIFGAQLIVLAATGTFGESNRAQSPVSGAEKTAIVQTYINRATECVVHAVESNEVLEPQRLGEFIVAAMPSCVDRMRAMIESFDRAYGEGAGEEFFSGSFLDLLPIAVSRRISR
jgi:hypothetical protein